MRFTVEKYMELKEQGMRDLDIAREFYMSPGTLTIRKRECGLIGVRKPYPNRDGVTDEEFAIAKQNGLSRKHVLCRVRDHGWKVERAITEPINPKRIPIMYRRKEK